MNPSLQAVESPRPLADSNSSEDSSGDEETEDPQGVRRLRERERNAHHSNISVGATGHQTVQKGALTSHTGAPTQSTPSTSRWDLKPPIETKVQPPKISSANSIVSTCSVTDLAVGDSCCALPAMQGSRLRTPSAGSIQAKQNLPSTKTTLDVCRPQHLILAAQGQADPSSRHSGTSRPGHSALDRSADDRRGSVPTLYDNGISASVFAFHFAPTQARSSERPDGSTEKGPSPESDNQHLHEYCSPFSLDTYKCEKPDCTAKPFLTQYLLKSHMTSHSGDRPYFCSVKNCSRGPGGQGFKRKNEMRR